MLCNRIMILLMGAAACLMASGCFSCSYQHTPAPATTVVTPPAPSTTVVQPAP